MQWWTKTRPITQNSTWRSGKCMISFVIPCSTLQNFTYIQDGNQLWRQKSTWAKEGSSTGSEVHCMEDYAREGWRRFSQSMAMRGKCNRLSVPSLRSEQSSRVVERHRLLAAAFSHSVSGVDLEGWDSLSEQEWAECEVRFSLVSPAEIRLCLKVILCLLVEIEIAGIQSWHNGKVTPAVRHQWRLLAGNSRIWKAVNKVVFQSGYYLPDLYVISFRTCITRRILFSDRVFVSDCSWVTSATAVLHNQ